MVSALVFVLFHVFAKGNSRVCSLQDKVGLTCAIRITLLAADHDASHRWICIIDSAFSAKTSSKDRNRKVV